jgi:hypothetical protein
VIALDHQGVRAFVPSSASWKVQVTNPAETVLALAGAIKRAAANPEERLHRAEAALSFAASQTWPRRVALMEGLYENYRYSV